MKSGRRKILFVFGTRPEALKLAPLILEAKRNPLFVPKVCLTAQHREMADQVLRLFKINPDYDLDLMVEGQTLGDLTHRLFSKFEGVVHDVKPNLILVQGDTTTAFAVALKAFYEKVPLAHVEAGLRTHNKYHPFPEEINRVLISRLADFHFAPTKEARRNLLREGIEAKKIFVTGNTVVDAIRMILPSLNGRVLQSLHRSKKIILVTAHRRENFGKPLQRICQAIKEVAEKHPEVEFVYPVHPNPDVQKIVLRELKDRKGIQLIPPLSYEDFLSIMNHSYLILTDSGGIQEEAPSFAKPVLVMREVSERMEGIRSGVAKLVGTSKEKIVRETSRLLKERKIYDEMRGKANPYGDGKAAERILDVLARHLG